MYSKGLEEDFQCFVTAVYSLCGFALKGILSFLYSCVFCITSRKKLWLLNNNRGGVLVHLQLGRPQTVNLSIVIRKIDNALDTCLVSLETDCQASHNCLIF